MSALNGDSPVDSESTTRWEGYSNYQYVSQQIAAKVSDAVESYAVLQSAGREGAKLDPREYMFARANILDAAMSLKVEVEKEANSNEDDDVYDEIIDRWETGGDEAEDGFIHAFHSHSIKNDGVPGWLFTFVEDIRLAAWELGYLQAGRTVSESNLEPADEQAKDMFT